MGKRYIGIDLHRNRFTCCIRLENERTYVTEWELEDLGKFVKKLRPSDEVAVEITGNTRLFYDAVAPHVARVVVSRLSWKWRERSTAKITGRTREETTKALHR